MLDLRSDDRTAPCEGMREAMTRASYQDNVRHEDTRTRVFEQRVAAMLGQQAAMLVPTGTMGNFLAMLYHCGRGDEFIVGDRYHIYAQEAGNFGALGSAIARPVPIAEDGGLHLSDVRPLENNIFRATTTLVCLENTHDGKPLPLGRLDDLVKQAHHYRLAVHLDGARLWNAAVAQQVPLSRLAGDCDSVMVCLNKGLGCPLGAVLAGSKRMIEKCYRLRKMIGGSVRQPGMFIAAAEYALEHNIDRLEQDHQHAKALAEQHGGTWTGTNMAFFEPGYIVDGIDGDLSTRRTRWVTHLSAPRDG